MRIEFQIFKFISVIIFVGLVFPLISLAESNVIPEQNQTMTRQKLQNTLNGSGKNGEQLRPVMSVTPREVNVGTITPDKSGESVFTIKNMSSGHLEWTSNGPEGWVKSEGQKLTGTLNSKTDTLHVAVRLIPFKSSSKEISASTALHNVEMTLENGNAKLVCHKEFSAGIHKEAIKMTYEGGLRTIFVTFTIFYTQRLPLISLNPGRLDMGSVLPEKIISRRITVTNVGKDVLKWSVIVPKHLVNETPANFKKGRYLSFLNEEVRGTAFYNVPKSLKDKIQLTGKWTENKGYPAGAEGENSFKLNFNGTGIILYLLSYPEDINLTVYLDNNPMDNEKLTEGIEEKKGELLVAEGLTDGHHVLTITGNDSRLALEGVKILGENISYFPAGSITIVPNSGAITRQNNYVQVTLNTGRMAPGYYSDYILFDNNGGDTGVEVFADVLPDVPLKMIDVYRYYNGNDYLFTSNPQAETNKIIQSHYGKEGIAFRLFVPETPGTTSFYRWYNPQNKSHFYHYDTAGGGKNIRGYIFEGSIGNIATSRLTNTKELYRWYNPKTGYYFYSTDLQGVKINKRAYRFDGIAGYVR